MECANCKKPAILACSSCKCAPINPGDAAIAHYCNNACQKADWANHKITCLRLKDRTTLYRVATTAQKLFYIARELTWGQLDVQRTEKKGDMLVMRGNRSETDTWPTLYKAFPSHLFPLKEDREAALSYLGCICAAAWMVEFAKGMLEENVLEMIYIECKTKNDKRGTMFYPNTSQIIFDTQSTIHEVLKLKLRSGEIFAVDLSGSQHGYHDPVME